MNNQVRLMFSGSHVYRPTMTIAEIAKHYTSTEDGSWALNVACHPGVRVETKLEDIR